MWTSIPLRAEIKKQMFLYDLNENKPAWTRKTKTCFVILNSLKFFGYEEVFLKKSRVAKKKANLPWSTSIKSVL